jgi:hypothetical protein
LRDIKQTVPLSLADLLGILFAMLFRPQTNNYRRFTALALLRLGSAAQKMYVYQSYHELHANSPISLTAHNLISPQAGEIWYAGSVLSALLLFGLAVFFFVFAALPYWFKVHKSLSEILGCMSLPLIS